MACIFLYVFVICYPVVIRKNYRGKGLGRKIMEETEDHARKY